MKKYWKLIVILSIVPFGIEMLWTLYNTYIPIYLQSGNAAFDAQNVSTTFGFGLGATATGFILTLDNILGLIVGPFIGMWSDRIKGQWGKRLPFVVIGIMIAAAGFALLPVAPTLISPDNNGNFSQLIGIFTLFIISALAVIIGYAMNSTLMEAIRWDNIPSEFRSKAKGAFSVITALGGIIALIFGASLYRMYQPLPFWVTAGILIVGVVLWIRFLKPGKDSTPEAVEHSMGVKDIFSGIKILPKEHGRSLIFLILSAFSVYTGVAIMEAFFTSYGVSVLEMQEADASNMFAVMFLAFLIFAVPVGYLSARFGRKRMVIVGLAMMTLISILLLFAQSITIIIVALVVFGISWAFIQINIPVMFVDTPPDDNSIGTYTGIGGMSTTLGFILGPVLGGALVEATGTNYNNIWVIQPIVYVIAILLMTQVTKGEMRKLDISSNAS